MQSFRHLLRNSPFTTTRPPLLALPTPLKPLTVHALPVDFRELSWEAATERMLDAAELRPEDWPRAASKLAEATLFSAYNAALGTRSTECTV